jgi:hypothetical protein
MQLHDLSEFLKLSSVLHYNLSAASLNRYNVLLFIIGEKHLSRKEKKDKEFKSIVMESLGFLFRAYSHKRRRLGPMAVIHPIRAAALYTRSKDEVRLEDLLSALFHDILEDIQPLDFEKAEWREMESLLFEILKRVGVGRENRLIENLLCLTRVSGESYYQYIGRLLAHATGYPEVVLIKLADRLDNTLDMRIELQDPLDGIDFFENVFQILFVRNYGGNPAPRAHPTSTALNGARRLHQLFKNAVLLSLVRQKANGPMIPEFRALFNALAIASLKEAERTLIHLTRHHYRDVEKQRRLLLEAMDYCYGGRIDLVTKPDEKYLLDGLFTTYFGFAEKKTLEQNLSHLYQDKPLMIEASVAFITIFLSFLNDEEFYVRGISPEGIDPR